MAFRKGPWLRLLGLGCPCSQKQGVLSRLKTASAPLSSPESISPFGAPSGLLQRVTVLGPRVFLGPFVVFWYELRTFDRRKPDVLNNSCQVILPPASFTLASTGLSITRPPHVVLPIPRP